MALLLKGSREEVVLDFTKPNSRYPQGLSPDEAYRLAARMRLRLLEMRAHMKDEGHPDWQLTYRCAIYSWKKGHPEQHLLRLRPKDSDLLEFVEQAGIDTTASHTEAPRPSTQLEDVSLDDILSNLTNVKDVL